jgi:hypothetical protein
MSADFTLGGQKLEQMDSFTYLRSTITLGKKSTTDIKQRIAQCQDQSRMV